MPGERSGPVEPVFNDADFTKSYPTLSAFLTDLKYADGAYRTTATLLIFCESSVLRVCLNDRDNNRSAFFTGETVEAALMSAENALCSETVDWRRKSGFGGNGNTPKF